MRQHHRPQLPQVGGERRIGMMRGKAAVDFGVEQVVAAGQTACQTLDQRAHRAIAAIPHDGGAPRSYQHSARHQTRDQRALEVRRGQSAIPADRNPPQSPRTHPARIGETELARVAAIGLSSHDAAQVVARMACGLMRAAVDSMRFQRPGARAGSRSCHAQQSLEEHGGAAVVDVGVRVHHTTASITFASRPPSHCAAKSPR